MRGATMVIDWAKRKIRRSGEFLEPAKFVDKREVFSKLGLESRKSQLEFESKMEEFLCYESKTRHYMFRYNYAKGGYMNLDEEIDVVDYSIVEDLRKF